MNRKQFGTVIDSLRTEYDEWIASLTPREIHAIEKYTWNSVDNRSRRQRFFDRLNSMLRGEYSENEQEILLMYSDIISGAIRKHTINRDVVCYRGSDHDMTGNAKIGEVFTIHQFVSTSVDRRRAFDGTYRYTIYVPKGAYVAYIERISKYQNQRELLIDRGTKFLVLSRDGGRIELEVIL